MKYYSQLDARWKDQKLGTCSDTLGQSGCKVTCFSMLISGEVKNPNGTYSESTPSIVDWIATKKSLYTNGCLISDEVFANYFDLEYNGKTTEAPDYTCIAETDHYKDKGVPQHFFIYIPDGNIIDPLDRDPKKKKNPYNIVSFRLIKEKSSGKGCCKEYNDLKENYKNLEKKLKDINNIINK